MSAARNLWIPWILASSWLVASPAYADARHLPFSYPYGTPDAGERELELATDLTSAGALENQLELEYGVTDRLSLSGYAVLGNLTTFKALKLEGRYRLAEKGELPIDTGLYLEYEVPLAAGAAANLEGKLLLEKTFGSFVLDSNLAIESSVATMAPAWGGTLGVAYQLSDAVEPGVELRLDDGQTSLGSSLALFWGPLHLNGGVYLGTSGVLGRLLISQEF